jgi:hypothetical protein
MKPFNDQLTKKQQEMLEVMQMPEGAEQDRRIAAMRLQDNQPWRWFGPGFLLIGAVLGYFMMWTPLSQMIAARDWTMTQCTIRSSQAVRHGQSARRQTATSSSYDLEVIYSFQANGRTVIGDRADFAPTLSGRSPSIKNVAARFPVGSTHECYYDPANPRSAVLDRTPWVRGMSLAFPPLGFLFFGVIITLALRSENRGLEEQAQTVWTKPDAKS